METYGKGIGGGGKRICQIKKKFAVLGHWVGQYGLRVTLILYPYALKVWRNHWLSL